jgi:transposase
VKELSRVEQFEVIRRQHRDEGLSIRELARRHRVHRRTVRQALGSAVPPPRKVPERAAPVLGAHEVTIRRWLAEDLQAPRKQRHTARQVHRRLVAEHGALVAESTVRAFVAQVRAEQGDRARGVTIGQEHAPGAEAEVDFGEFQAWVDGVLARLWLFVLRLSCSGRGFAVAFAHQAQEAFFEGHVLAFAELGGVPGRVRYDNLKPAVTRILVGRDRVENERFIALRSHYGYDSFFCEPGEPGAHEKGGVEGEVGRFRRAHLVPVPQVASLEELNQLIAERVTLDEGRRIARRTQTVGETFTAERGWLHPLPAEPFDAARLVSAKVDAKARVCVVQSWYSVPARLAGRRVQVRLGARALDVLDPGSAQVVATHPRSLHKGSQDLVLDHYLEILARKPGALPGSTALAQAREQGVFTDSHDRFWTAARRAHGDQAGTRALIEVLLAGRRLPAEAVTAGIDAALGVGSTDPALVAIEARRLRDIPDPSIATVIPLQRALARDERPPPTLGRYDTLLDAARTTLAPVVPIGAGS